MTDEKCLKAVITSGKRLVIFLHDNPDPDAMAAGWLLRRLSESWGVRAVVVYGGRLGRAENRAMVRLLRIPLRHLDRKPVRFLKSDRYALVDTIPGAGNNSFPGSLRPHVVIDHHSPCESVGATFEHMADDAGCATAMVLKYYLEAGLTPGSDLATAAAYAILSETQDLEREASRADRESYQRLLPLIRLTALGRIRHPPREREMYRTIARAMRRVEVGRHTCVCHAGRVPYAEAVAEVADFLAAMERVTWCMVTGLHGSSVVVSIRTSRQNGHAERMIRKVLGEKGRGGGHGRLAGGTHPVKDPEEYDALAAKMARRFLRALSRRFPVRLQPLLPEEL